jgi:hypothetical protein
MKYSVLLFLLILAGCDSSQRKPTPKSDLRLNFKSYKKLTYTFSESFKTLMAKDEQMIETIEMAGTGILTITPQNDSTATVTMMMIKGSIVQADSGGHFKKAGIDSTLLVELKNLRRDGTFPEKPNEQIQENLGYTSFLFLLPKIAQRVGEHEVDSASFKMQTGYKPMTLRGPRTLIVQNRSINGGDTILSILSQTKLGLSKSDSTMYKLVKASQKSEFEYVFNKSKGYFQKVTGKFSWFLDVPSMKFDPGTLKSTHLIKTKMDMTFTYSLTHIE